MSRTPKILYVAGYSRSGSTLLDVLLSAHSDVAGVGEVTFLLDDWSHPSRRCTCGAPYERCTFWGDLFGEGTPDDESRTALRRIEARRSLPRLLSGRARQQDVMGYRDLHDRVFRYVRARSGCSVVLDSSKSARAAAGRFWALRCLVGEEVYVVHLVRSGLATLRSVLVNGDNWAAEGYRPAPRAPVLRALLGWVLSNLTATLLGRRFRERYLLVRYEDLVAEPSRTLRRIGGLIGLDLSGVIERVEAGGGFRPGHNVGGNRMRLERSVRLQPPTAPAGAAPLPRRYRWAFALIGGGLDRAYGYGTHDAEVA